MWWRIKSHHIFGVCIFLLAFLWPYRSYAFAPFLLVFRHVFSYHTKLWATLLGAVWRLLKFLLLPVVSLLWDSMPENAMGCILLIVALRIFFFDLNKWFLQNGSLMDLFFKNPFPTMVAFGPWALRAQQAH